MQTIEERAFPRRGTNWLSNTKWSTLKTYNWITLYRLTRFYIFVYVCGGGGWRERGRKKRREGKGEMMHGKVWKGKGKLHKSPKLFKFKYFYNSRCKRI